METDNFQKLLIKNENPLVVIAEGGFLKSNFQYLTSYKGLIFFTKSYSPLQLPGKAEVVSSKKIWIPG